MNRLSDRYPGGCFVGFNWSIDRFSAAHLIDTVASLHNEGYSRVHLMLHSDGGLIEDAHQLVNSLLAFPITYVTHNVGVIQSAANLLFAVGSQRVAAKGSTFFFHQTGFPVGIQGRVSEAEARAHLERILAGDERAAQVMAEKTGIPTETVTAWQKGETTLSAEAARDAGLIHTIGDPIIGPTAFVKHIVLPK